jgi:hypothetical protein
VNFFNCDYNSTGMMIGAKECHSSIARYHRQKTQSKESFSISDGLYTEAEIYQGDELVEKVANTWSVRAVSRSSLKAS